MRTTSMIGLVFVFIACVGDGMAGFQESIPGEIQGWKAQGEDETYNSETLFALINGGAELYLSYGFREAWVRRYMGPEKREISLEIYDMGRSEDAFGVFSSERQDEDIGIGQGSEYGGGLLRFWKDRFFVSLTTTGEESRVRDVMIRLAEETAKAIGKEGSKPRLVSLLPERGLQRDSIRFFHTAAILDRQYFLSNRNILHLGKDTDCVLAKYADGYRAAQLLLVRYAGAEAAREALDDFVSSYVPEARNKGKARMENGAWVFVRIEGTLLIVVLDATSESLGQRLVSMPINTGKK
ncbi:MAG: hypothetical protein HY788_03685 [Deltaproteobacteria bacterium]|nr:hypothetical protein [Deltaproteobacteria bacterium]